MTEKVIAPYGSWTSPITTDLLLAGSVSLGHLQLDGEAIYWTEGRPLDGGRNTIVRWTAEGGAHDLTLPPFNARSRVHEYGGGAMTVHDGTLYVTNDADQRIYRLHPGGTPEPLTQDAPLRYADMVVDAGRDRLICIREDHRSEGEPVNTLVAVPLDGGEQVVLAEGHDFYASPSLSPDGRQLAWLTWDHPDMPWDGTTLWLAEIQTDGTLSEPSQIAGGRTESIFQPAWSPDGVLHFTSDRTDWWNLYRHENGETTALYAMDAEFGMPQWVFGLKSYGFESASSIICAYTQDGQVTMARLDTVAGTLTPLDLPDSLIYPSYGQLQVANGVLAYIGASPTHSPAVIRVDLATDQPQVLRESSTITLDDDDISTAALVTFPTENGQSAYGFYYPPRNAHYSGPDDERPPLMVTIHGGPTSGANDYLSLGQQYWTSRGFAVLDVIYGGSTGFGRPYRQRLNGNWGIVDVDDCRNGARYLVEQGLVDGKRLAIRGGSAGGYTTLAAITFHDDFQAAASHFGVSDAEALAQETHKFESRYLDSLIGPYPEMRERYIERSPIHFADQVSAALILFQGLEDKVVPPAQSEAMFIAARNKELPVAYVTFEGEQHGFRKAESIKRALESELYFYGRIFGFEPADAIEPVSIENLDE